MFNDLRVRIKKQAAQELTSRLSVATYAAGCQWELLEAYG